MMSLGEGDNAPAFELNHGENFLQGLAYDFPLVASSALPIFDIDGPAIAVVAAGPTAELSSQILEIAARSGFPSADQLVIDYATMRAHCGTFSQKQEPTVS